MRVKIDSTAVVPVGWVLSGMGAVITGTVMGVFWISTVNFRLQRIEEKLGIPNLHTDVSTLDSAFAGMEATYASTDRIFKPLQLMCTHNRPTQSH